MSVKAIHVRMVEPVEMWSVVTYVSVPLAGLELPVRYVSCTFLLFLKVCSVSFHLQRSLLLFLHCIIYVSGKAFVDKIVSNVLFS